MTRAPKPGPAPKPPDEKYEKLTVRAHPDDAARLRACAKERGLSLGAYIVAAMDHLERLQRPHGDL